MKKITLLALTLTIGLSLPVMAQTECRYSDDQNIVRSAEFLKEMKPLQDRRVNLNQNYPCGGTLMQLAVVRGITTNLKFLIMNGARADVMVPTADFPIFDAPPEIPLILFAARFAPNGNIIQELLNAGADAKVLDSKKRDIFWYFDRNPALRETYLTKGGYKELVSSKR